SVLNVVARWPVIRCRAQSYPSLPSQASEPARVHHEEDRTHKGGIRPDLLLIALPRHPSLRNERRGKRRHLPEAAGGEPTGPCSSHASSSPRVPSLTSASASFR